MEEMKIVKLKSGSILKIGSTPFETSKGLFQAVVKNLKSVELPKGVTTYEGFVGALLGAQLSDTEIEKWLWACMNRCLYQHTELKKELKIDPSIFENMNHREDFIEICIEVGKENLQPFMKALYLALPHLMATLESIQ